MRLEPRVVQRINGEKSKARRQRILTRAPLPAGMKSLLGRLAAEMGEVEYTLQLQYVSRYLFICPPRAVAASGEPGETESAGAVAFRGVLAKTLDYADASLALRLENLEIIEGGRWTAFEDRVPRSIWGSGL
ncbi:MAG: hypothetical protein C4536_11960 [Actinobacteria bacterium]|jgi:hypothetical protein|nr:MAG: hypothetical protein C4536_11960 [Actinomycetota bacterium]